MLAPLLSRVQLFETPWTAAHQTPLSMGFSRQEYWGRLPFSSPGDLAHPGNEPASLTSHALAGRFFTTSATWEALEVIGIAIFSLSIVTSRWFSMYKSSTSLVKFIPTYFILLEVIMCLVAQLCLDSLWPYGL